MARGSFLKASKGGAGFQEGYVRIDRSVATVFQYPPNSTTGLQSAPFCALVWTGVKLTPEWKPMEENGEPVPFEIINRMGDLDKIRPGKLDPKDFTNTEVSPEDLGVEVGVEGNAFFFEDESAQFSIGWNVMKDSLEKCAFKASVLGLGVASDFEGTVAHFKQQEGAPYIAKKDGRNQHGEYKKGDSITSSNLVCDKIHTFGYEVDKKAAKTTAKPAPAKAGSAASAPASAAAAPAPSTDETEPNVELASILAEPSPQFKDAVFGKTVKRADFNKQLTNELMRRKYKPKATKAIMDFVKSDELAGMGESTELFTVDGDSIAVAAV